MPLDNKHPDQIRVETGKTKPKKQKKVSTASQNDSIIRHQSVKTNFLHYWVKTETKNI